MSSSSQVMERSKQNCIFSLFSVNVDRVRQMISTETCSKLFRVYFKCSSRKEIYTVPKQICQHLPGSVIIMEEKQIIF